MQARIVRADSYQEERQATSIELGSRIALLPASCTSHATSTRYHFTYQCTYMYIYIYTYVYIRIFSYYYIHIYFYTYVYVHLDFDVHICIYVFVSKREGDRHFLEIQLVGQPNKRCPKPKASRAACAMSARPPNRRLRALLLLSLAVPRSEV